MKVAHLDRQPEPVKPPRSAGVPLAIELRHLRYFVAVSYTHLTLPTNREV